MTNNDAQFNRMERLESRFSDMWEVLDNVRETINRNIESLEEQSAYIWENYPDGMKVQGFKNELLDTVRFFEEFLGEAADDLGCIEFDIKPL